ncbi:PREDICTED: coiled-coil domain-containing protein 181 [Gekko japonicus]|uniref:Coiled-coil domain-containing protein 181 n=1 Tax=Gekko japonicus TaxID=146911 RepID=A0ABM1JYK5_GEKJA|nr:PREDICTED: coiled-coil domain-containing protein 181 [Gekko japonicus]XP_015266543.1 PREDICTED: coiled-coil domain-containing protein 181 [Gekko japonicus]
MSYKKDTSESADSGDSIETGEYEDDFEKDLEWLINEEEKGISDNTQNHEENEEEVETNINKEDQEERRNTSKEPPEPEEALKDERRNSSKEPPNPKEALKDEGLQNQAGSPMRWLEQMSDTDSESSCQESNQEDLEEDDEEIKRYILGKIEEANKLLLSQEPLDENKEKKLKFKDHLVDLEVPPLNAIEIDKNDPHRERDISGRLSQFHISNEPGQEDIPFPINGALDDEHKDGKILVERDGKFELLSIRDIESQGFFPPLSVSFSDIEAQHISPKSSHAAVFGTFCLTKEETLSSTSCSPSREGFLYFPQPPPIRPSSAINITRNVERGKSPRRVQSANVGIRSSTYCLSPRQKELQKQMEQRRERLRKQEEACKREQEEEKKKENDLVFKAWLEKKKGQMQEERRIQRAKELEDLNRQDSRNPDEAFRLWLKKKQREHVKEKQLENQKQREECMFFLPRTTENEKAYKQWLKKKRQEKRAEVLAAKERSKQLRQEARRAKQIENILCSISEPRTLRFTDQYS